MRPTKRVTFDFYRVETALDGGFVHGIRKIFALPITRRDMDKDGVPVRLQTFLPEGSLMYGDLIKIRMDDLPSKASRSLGTCEPLGLPADQGLGEATLFAYHEPSRVLLLQRNKSGTSANLFRDYLDFHTGDRPQFLPVLTERELLRIAMGMGEITKLEISFATPDHAPPALAGADLSVQRINEIATNAGAAQVSLTLSRGRSRKSALNRRGVLAAIKYWYRNKDAQNVKRLRLYGKNENMEPEKLDFLLEQIQSEQEAHYDSNSRSVPFLSRKAAAMKAWLSKKDELLRHLRAAS